jgi:hypothetical protein
MYEYNVPLDDHIALPEGLDLEEQFPLAVGTIGDFAADALRRRIGLSSDEEPATAEDVQFAGRVLQAFVDAQINETLTPDLLLLASSAFYISGRPGDSIVLLRRLRSKATEETRLLETALRWSLGEPWKDKAPGSGTSSIVASLSAALAQHFHDGQAVEVTPLVARLHAQAYANGDPHELLLADLFGAVVLLRVERSAWSLLPAHSKLERSDWSPYLTRADALREMWPSQRLLGDAGLYAGASAVVQMPTSAGKTRATELVIRSAFLSRRTTLAVIVAPFRALCQEIANALQTALAPDGYRVNQLSDALQTDYSSELFELLDIDAVAIPHVVILTPEKLLYVLRPEPDLIQRIGLMIYDEAHQFDTGSRGVTYELLLTSIKRLLQKEAQSVLISAVIRNAAALASWLFDDADQVVADNRLQTQRSIAFATWPSAASYGQLEFNRGSNVEQPFFVPRVIVAEQLARRGKETVPRFFPERASGSVALYLALRLVPNGAIAIFAGTKLSAAKIVRDAATEIFARNVSLQSPAILSDPEELGRLVLLFSENFGGDSYLTQSASLGIFAHHGNTPHGLRLAIEHAMRAGSVRLVVCTSTLAQGVNLPIRYLLITSTMQGDDAIRGRDFHNLMGRAGRAGMHGEGTVIFTDPSLYDGQNVSEYGKSRWNAVQSLLTPENAEPTGSSLLDLLEPLKSEDGRWRVAEPPIDVIRSVLDDREAAFAAASDLDDTTKARGFTTKSLLRQLDWKVQIIAAVESFLMAYRGDAPPDAFYTTVRELASETLAFSLGTEEEQDFLVAAFDAIARKIESSVPQVEMQARFGRTLLGVDAALKIDAWATENIASMRTIANEAEALSLVWPLLTRMAQEERLRDTEPAESIRELAIGWIAGTSFGQLHAKLAASGARYPHGKQRRTFSIDMVVELCEQTFGFQFSLILAAVAGALRNVAATEGEAAEFEARINLLQKRLKYGLPSASAVAIFEAGFAERVVAQAINGLAGDGLIGTRVDVRKRLRAIDAQIVDAFFDMYPTYFRSVYDSLGTS